MHGGRWAIAGFLYQILGSLGYVGHVAVTDANYRHDKLLRLQLRLEPQDGGDLTTESSDGRIVEQFKLRGSGRAWSASEIIDEVFPDLLRNVFTSTHIIGTRYRFTTNGRVVAQPLRDLLAEIGRIGPDANPLSVLDNNNATFLFRREYLTARSFFTKIMQASGCYDGDAKRLWNFLYRFEINDLISEQDYLDNIDELLSRLVEDEPIESTRDTLIGQLLRRAKAGATVTPAEILSTANLNWNILEKRNQIRARLREQTNRMIASEQYDRSLDARASAPPLTENWFTVLTGESGQGKTWQLLRLAHDYIEQHKSCVFLRDIQSIKALEKALLKVLWHQSGYDRTLPLGNALERIADVLPKAPEPLLTVFLDDVQSRDFAIRLLDPDFNQLRLRFVLTAQPRIAHALEKSFRGQPHIIPIDRFTLRELRNYLLKQHIDWAKLPSDVLELLKQPILAKLYVDIAQEGWTPETGYALLDRYWRQATIERRDQVDHAQDAVTLKALAMNLFDGMRYPWPQRSALEVGLTDDVQLRLISVGLIRRYADQRIALFHDRLLNWVVAEALAERVLDRDLSLKCLREMFLRILRVDTDWRDDNLVSRLGYVPMDVLWLLAESIPPDQIADLVNEWVRGSQLGGDSSAIFSGLLATLGGRILPALEQFAVRYLSTEDVWTLSSDVAKGIVVAGAGSAIVLKPLMTRLIASDDLSAQRVGLIIAAAVPLRDQIERIWVLHRIYRVRRVEMGKFDGALEDFRYKISLDALVNVAGAYPDWVERKIRATQNEDDLVELVYLMMKLKREIGAELWGKTKEYLFARLPAGRRCLSQAIDHFRDESCIDWLLCVEANGYEPLAIETRFDALVRLAPAKALEFLKMMSTDGPFRSTKGWRLQPLIQKIGEPAQQALRRFFNDGEWTGVRNLAILFQGDEDLVDDETLTLIIDTFEARLEANDHVEDWQFTGEEYFLRLLSKICSPRLLRLLESKRGSRFEELLARRAIRQGGRTGLKVKPDALEYSQLLLKIGGKGISEVIANDLSCESHWARSDALKRVQWFPTPKIRSQVLRLAQNDHHEKIEEVHLMEALASLEEDAAFAEMLRKGTPAYLTALKIRRSKSPIPKAVRDQACSDALSADENTQHSGIAILSLCKGRKVTRCLQRVLESNGSDSRAAHEAIWALDQIEHYSDQILPLVTRMINHQDSQLVVFNYLLHHGGQGEAVIADYLANHDRTEITIEDQVARILVSRREKTGSAASFLWDIVKKRKSLFDSNTNLLALSEIGDRLADDLLFENAIAERSFSSSPAVAIEAIASQDPEYAFEAATRLLERDAEAGGEEILLSVDAKRAICFILRLLEQDIGALSRWRIYRHLRWLAPHRQLAAKLRDMAKDDSPRKRELACEILGWLPPGILDSCLEACANDIERNVEQAAIEALKKRQAQRDVEELLSEMAAADGPARWSRLYAILDLFDPRTLARREDPLCIWPALDGFPYDFTMEAETILK